MSILNLKPIHENFISDVILSSLKSKGQLNPLFEQSILNVKPPEISPSVQQGVTSPIVQGEVQPKVQLIDFFAIPSLNLMDIKTQLSDLATDVDEGKFSDKEFEDTYYNLLPRILEDIMGFTSAAVLKSGSIDVYNMNKLGEVEISFYGYDANEPFYQVRHQLPSKFTYGVVVDAGDKNKFIPSDLVLELGGDFKNDYTQMKNEINAILSLFYFGIPKEMQEKYGYFYNIRNIVKPMMSVKSVQKEEKVFSQVDIAHATDGLVKPQSDIKNKDDLDALPYGSVLEVGQYIVAKYKSNKDLYNIISLPSGEYTQQAFDTKNLLLYAEQKNVQPQVIIDPTSSLKSIIDQYNDLYPSEVLKKALNNLGYSKPLKNIATKRDFKYNYSYFYEIPSEESLFQMKDAFLYEKGTGNMWRWVGNELYCLHPFDETKTYTWKEVQRRQLCFLTPYDDQIYNDNESVLESVPTLSEEEYGLKEVDGEYQLEIKTLQGKTIGKYNTYLMNTVAQAQAETGNLDKLESIIKHVLLSPSILNSYRVGNAIVFEFAGYGAYYILIDQHLGNPVYYLQFAQQGSTNNRMILSNELSANGKPFWEVHKPTKGHIQQEIGSQIVNYEKRLAFNSIDNAVKMIATHIILRLKEGIFNIFHQEISEFHGKDANPEAPNDWLPISPFYASGSGNIFAISNVPLPTQLDTVQCGAMIIVPKGLGTKGQVFLIKRNNKWGIPSTNLTVGQKLEDCALHSLHKMFSNLPKKIEDSGVILSSKDNDSTTSFHTVLFQVESTTPMTWIPKVKRGQGLEGYAWIDEDDLNSGIDISWQPVLSKSLSSKQKYIDQNNQESVNSVLGAWKVHSDQWKKGTPVDPRLVKLLNDVNLQQIKDKSGLFFDGIAYDYNDIPPSMLSISNFGIDKQLPMTQLTARGSNYKNNPRKNKKSFKLKGFRRNGEEQIFRYSNGNRNYLVTLNPSKKCMKRRINSNHISKYKSIVEKTFGLKNPSRDILEKAYVLDKAGLPLEKAKINPETNEVLKLSLDEQKAVVDFADLVKDKVSTSNILQLIGSGLKARSSSSAYVDSEDYIQVEDYSIAQVFRYVPLLRMYGLYPEYFNMGERVVKRVLGSGSHQQSTYLGKGNNFQVNEWSIGQFNSLVKHFPTLVKDDGITPDFEDGENLRKMVKLWLEIQSGKRGGGYILVRKNLLPNWEKVAYSEHYTVTGTFDPDTTSLYKQDVPAFGVQNAWANIEGFWLSYFNFVHEEKTVTGFSTKIDWTFGNLGTSSGIRFRANTRDPRFINQAGEAVTVGMHDHYTDTEREICFVYVDKQPLPVQITDLGTEYALTQKQRHAYLYARPPHRKLPYPKGEYDQMVKFV